jgi:YHS domain-containing protein
MANDPVCYAFVDEENAPFVTTYQNRMYYFCCNYCKKQFEENPKRYSRIPSEISIDGDLSC